MLTKDVKTLLFEGYNDSLLTVVRKMNVTKIPYSKFAWFYGVSTMDQMCIKQFDAYSFKRKY